MSPKVLVIGAGIGGISAALWLRDRHVTFDWVEASGEIGGTLRRVGNPIDELAGLKAHSGPELVERYRAQLHHLNITPVLNQRVEHVEPLSDHRLRIDFEGGSDAIYDAIIVSTGTRPRRLELPWETELCGKGVEVSVTRTRERYRDKAVAVVGGGDAALEGLLLLTDVTDQIHLIHRRTTFRAQARFIREVTAHPHITLHLNQQVHSLLPTPTNDGLAEIVLSDGTHLPVEGLFVRIGVVPEYPNGILSSSRPAYLESDAGGRGTIPGVYIVGDVGAAHYQSVGWAMGSAARAVLTLCHDFREYFGSASLPAAHALKFARET